MNLPIFGLVLLIFLIVPPVANLMESVMIIHMHMQMPMLIIAGFFMGRFIIERFPRFFEKWNANGIPGILLFLIVLAYWMLPRTMDEALNLTTIELFKFISLPFLAGVPLRDSWKKLKTVWKNAIIITFTVTFVAMGLLYIISPVQLCNNYLIIEQITLGWGFLTMALGLAVYLIYDAVVDKSQYE